MNAQVRQNQFASNLLGYLLSIPIAFVFLFLVIITEFWIVFLIAFVLFNLLLWDLIAKE